MNHANRDALCAYVARKLIDLLDDQAAINDCEYNVSQDRFACKVYTQAMISLDDIKVKLQNTCNFKDITMTATPSYILLGFTGAWMLYEPDIQQLIDQRSRRSVSSQFLLAIIILSILICVFSG